MAFEVPFIGRLHPIEYLALGLSLFLLLLEGIIRLITLALPTPLITLCYRVSRSLFHRLTTTTAALSSSRKKSPRTSSRKKAIVQQLVRAADFVELCEIYGYTAEEHVVQTTDGYFLGLHRLAWKRGEEDERVNAGPGSTKKKVVFCMHGLLMNSEVWVCLTEKERCLPFALVDQGYDVWFGNNRGNKYSKKSTFASPSDTKFWSFSLDDFAFHDIPDSINYVLTTTGQPNLAYIGFSQGTAQAFAALSIQPTLNDKVSLFVALAPAMAPPALSSGFVDSLMRASPDFMFLAFGRRAILASTTMWQAILYPPIFVRVIDMSLKFLFGWAAMNITAEQKLAAYPHLYSFTSVKSVVHWFQIIRRGRFQMYDDEPSAPWHSLAGSSTRYYQVAKFPTRNIRTPILLVYGGKDGLIDISVMRRELPKRAGNLVVREVPHYEHLDFLWASDVQRRVFPVVFEALERGISGMVGIGSVEDLAPDSPGRAEFSDGGGTTAVGTARGTEDEREQEDFFSDPNNLLSNISSVGTSAEDGKETGNMVARGARRLSTWLINSTTSAAESATSISSQAASRIPLPSLPLSPPNSNSGTSILGTTADKDQSETQALKSSPDTPLSTKPSKSSLTFISPKGITVSPGKAVGGLSLSDGSNTTIPSPSRDKIAGTSGSGHGSSSENSPEAVSGNESGNGLKKGVISPVDGNENIKGKKKKGRKGSVAP